MLQCSNYLEVTYSSLQAERILRAGNAINLEQKILFKLKHHSQKNVFDSIIAAILYVAEHNLAFRRSQDALCTARNGLMQLTATSDRILEDHVS
jgi:hypothetical protein